MNKEEAQAFLDLANSIVWNIQANHEGPAYSIAAGEECRAPTVEEQDALSAFLCADRLGKEKLIFDAMVDAGLTGSKRPGWLDGEFPRPPLSRGDAPLRIISADKTLANCPDFIFVDVEIKS